MVDEIKTEYDDLTGKEEFSVEIDGERYKLELDVNDLHPLVAMGGNDTPDSEDLDNISEALRHVLYRTYLPHWDHIEDKEPGDLTEAQRRENEKAKKKVDAFLRDEYMDLVRGIIEELGWGDEKANATVQAKKEELDLG